MHELLRGLERDAAAIVEQNAAASEETRTAEAIRETIKPVASSAQVQSQAAADVAEAAAQMSDQLAMLEKNVNELRGHSETLSNQVVKFFTDDEEPPRTTLPMLAAGARLGR